MNIEKNIDNDNWMKILVQAFTLSTITRTPALSPKDTMNTMIFRIILNCTLITNHNCILDLLLLKSVCISNNI